jgi:hypothetical protein
MKHQFGPYKDRPARKKRVLLAWKNSCHYQMSAWKCLRGKWGRGEM